MKIAQFIAAGMIAAVPFAVASGANGASAIPDPQAMLQTATGFYDIYLSLHPSDGIPDTKLRARFTPFISQSLDKLMEDGEAAQERYAKITKNQAPPLIEGDLFTPNFEGATSLKIGTCAPDANGGHCSVAMVYDDGKDKPIKWTDTVVLEHSASGWCVSDVEYGGTNDFGNKGSLTDTIRNAINDGNSVSN